MKRMVATALLFIVIAAMCLVYADQAKYPYYNHGSYRPRPFRSASASAIELSENVELNLGITRASAEHSCTIDKN